MLFHASTSDTCPSFCLGKAGKAFEFNDNILKSSRYFIKQFSSMRIPQRAFLHFLILFCFLSFQFLMAEEIKQPLSSPDQEAQPPEQPGGGGSFLLVRGCPIGNAPAKTEWPEVVGLAAEDAEQKIKQDMPEAVVHVVPPDRSATADFDTGRVRLYTDSAGLVARPARIG